MKKFIWILFLISNSTFGMLWQSVASAIRSSANAAAASSHSQSSFPGTILTHSSGPTKQLETAEEEPLDQKTQIAKSFYEKIPIMYDPARNMYYKSTSLSEDDEYGGILSSQAFIEEMQKQIRSQEELKSKTNASDEYARKKFDENIELLKQAIENENIENEKKDSKGFFSFVPNLLSSYLSSSKTTSRTNRPLTTLIQNSDAHFTPSPFLSITADQRLETLFFQRAGQERTDLYKQINPTTEQKEFVEPLIELIASIRSETNIMEEKCKEFVKFFTTRKGKIAGLQRQLAFALPKIEKKSKDPQYSEIMNLIQNLPTELEKLMRSTKYFNELLRRENSSKIQLEININTLLQTHNLLMQDLSTRSIPISSYTSTISTDDASACNEPKSMSKRPMQKRLLSSTYDSASASSAAATSYTSAYNAPKSNVSLRNSSLNSRISPPPLLDEPSLDKPPESSLSPSNKVSRKSPINLTPPKSTFSRTAKAQQKK